MNDLARKFLNQNAVLPAAASILVGGLVWAILGAILNIAIPLIGLIICCERLGGVYYTIAYWLPLLSGAAIAGLAFLRQMNQGDV